MSPMAATIGRLLCVLAAAAACACVAAGASAATSPKEWVADANAICTNLMLQEQAMPKRMRTVDQLTKWLLKQVALERKALEKIAALERPPSMRAGIEKMVRSARAAFRLVPPMIRALRRKQSARYLKLAKRAHRHAVRANQVAAQLGAHRCAQV
jgi:hypothetical protein